MAESATAEVYARDGRRVDVRGDRIRSSLHRYLVYPTLLLLRGEGSLYRALEQYSRMQWWDGSQLAEYQRLRLRRVVKRAVARSPYYRDRIDSTRFQEARDLPAMLAKLPMLRKRDIQQHASRIQCSSWYERVSRKTTGGSTGEPVTILKDRRAAARERAAMWLGYGWFGIRMGDKGARLWGSPRSTRERLSSRLADFGMRRIRFSAFSFRDADFEEFWKRCVSSDLTYLHGYVSMIEQFAAFIQSRGYDGSRIGLRAIVVTSEVLTSPQRKLIQETFRAPVQIEYGCGEAGPIAYECEESSLHLMSPNLIVEVVTPKGTATKRGEIGSIVITDLYNRAAPLLRYQIGDFGSLGGPCECGRGLPVLEKVWGREYDFVVTPAGRRFHGEYFMYLFQDLKDAGHGVRQFQVLQRDVQAIELRIVPDGLSGETEGVRDNVRHMLHEGLQEMNLDIRIVDRIERAPSGKMQVIRNDWLRESAERT